MSCYHAKLIRYLILGIFLISLGMPFVYSRWIALDLDRDRQKPYGFYLQQKTNEIGIKFVHTKPSLDPQLSPIMPHLTALGSSISVVDYNNDGWQDLYVTNSRNGKQNGLFQNKKNGTFEEVAKEVGLADLNGASTGVSMGSIWGDYNNDGFEDVFVYKWGRQLLYRNQGNGVFENVTPESGLDFWMNANSAVWTDINRDGFIDLYIGGYFPEEFNLWKVETTRIMQESFEYANNGGRNYLFLNRGNGKFEDVTYAYGVECTRWTMSVGAADLNGDKWPDLYLANDYGPEVLFINQEGKKFEQASGTTLEQTSKSGMNVAFGDLYNDGTPDVYVTNISKPGYLFQGNNLRRNLITKNGKMINIAIGEIANAGWSWGAQFGDLNNDGYLDLFVANGFISANPEKDYWYEMGQVAMGNNQIFQDVNNWAAMDDQSLSGYETSRLYLNDGAGGFYDVAKVAGIVDQYDGRGVALVDLFNRGMLDVVVANQNGPLLVYQNQVDEENSWISFDLKGISSNSSAIGAEIHVYWENNQQVQFVSGGDSFAAQSQRRRHFGLGNAVKIEKVEIFWPSGLVQILTDPPLNQIHFILEPEKE